VLAGVLGYQEAGHVHCVEAVFLQFGHMGDWEGSMVDAVVYSLALLKMGTKVPEIC